ncbi:MAG: hypothetical protein CM1200mP29_04110 [Verrucomicrobiota bacterium]|nr:MAG: hypothetical protein CM1200mP29_04110 [Verrucomicrobiota bacterium]
MPQVGADSGQSRLVDPGIRSAAADFLPIAPAKAATPVPDTWPRLKGSANRFSPKDLYRAILFPQTPIFRHCIALPSTECETGEKHTRAQNAFYAAEGGFFANWRGNRSTRPSGYSITKPSEAPIMPEGLLEGLGEENLADLFQYIKSYERKKTGQSPGVARWRKPCSSGT